MVSRAALLVPARKILICALIFLGLLALYGWQLSRPAVLVWDEQIHVPAAQAVLAGTGPKLHFLRHPPLGKEIMALSIWALGEGFFTYRFPSALAAAASGLLVFLLGWKLTNRWGTGIVAVLFWSTSTLVYLHARLAMLDMMTTFFFLAAWCAYFPIIKNPQASSRNWLYLACALVAIGGGIKIIDFILYPIFFLGLILLRRQWPLKKSLPHFFIAALGFPILFFCLAFLREGYSLPEFRGLLRAMYALQVLPHRDFAGLSPWYDWFLLKAQVWYWSPHHSSSQRFGALCVNNPVLWLAGTVSILFLLLRGPKSQRLGIWLFSLAVPLQIVFWMIFKKQTILTYGLLLEPMFCIATPALLQAFSAKLKKVPNLFWIWSLILVLGSGYYFWRVFPEVFGQFY